MPRPRMGPGASGVLRGVILRLMGRLVLGWRRFMGNPRPAEPSRERVPGWLMAAIPPLAIVLLAATLGNHVLGNPPELASLSLVVYVLLAWGADRVRDPWSAKAAAVRLGAIGALLSDGSAWLTSWMA